MEKFRLLDCVCERCGKRLKRNRRFLIDDDTLQLTYPILCATCATPKEKRQILDTLDCELIKELEETN